MGEEGMVGVVAKGVEVGCGGGEVVGGLGLDAGLNLGGGEVGAALDALDADAFGGFDLPDLVYIIIYAGGDGDGGFDEEFLLG